MARYIDAEKMHSLLEEEIEGCGNPTADDNPIAYGTTLGLKMALSYAKTLQTADVAPVVHAHWERKAYFPDGTPAWVCSRCGHPEEVKYSHCNCGAKMDEEVKK